MSVKKRCPARYSAVWIVTLLTWWGGMPQVRMHDRQSNTRGLGSTANDPSSAF
jgi:hypothetical protein